MWHILVFGVAIRFFFPTPPSGSRYFRCCRPILLISFNIIDVTVRLALVSYLRSVMEGGGGWWLVQVEVASTPCTGLAVACAGCHPIVHWERRHHKKREPFGSGFREPLRAALFLPKSGSRCYLPHFSREWSLTCLFSAVVCRWSDGTMVGCDTTYHAMWLLWNFYHCDMCNTL